MRSQGIISFGFWKSLYACMFLSSLKAFIVTPNPDALKSEEVLSFCEQNISKIKTPKIIEFIDSIPRNANGKVLKTTLRKDS